MQRSRTVYLDYAATTPVDPQVAEAMMGCLTSSGSFANPSSDHDLGLHAAELIEEAREQVAKLIGAIAREITFTSGATEAINLAVKGALSSYKPKGSTGHVITSRIEHKAMLDVADWLEKQGVEVTRLLPNSDGVISAKQVHDALRDDTILVSMQWVNNELGTIQPIRQVATLLSNHPARLHVDAAQAAGKLPVHVAGIDYLSLAAHKFYGPKGVGALYCSARPRARVAPLIHGAGQESGIRSGTLATHQIVGMGVAAKLAVERLDADIEQNNRLGGWLHDQLASNPSIHVNAHNAPKVNNIVNCSVKGVNGRALRLALRDLYLASGSACSSASAEPSFVLKSLGHSDQLAEASLRFSIGRETSQSDLEYALARTHYEVKRLQEIAGE